MRDSLSSLMQKITTSRIFEMSIMVVILINCIFIGLETYGGSPVFDLINKICLYIYTAEISMRFMARISLKKFFTNAWNLFDLFVVLAGYIPEDITSNAGVIAAIRVLRVFRILKLFKTSMELRLIISVMVRSMRALTYNAMVMLIFMYVFAIAGIYFFRLPTPETATPEQQVALVKLAEVAPHAPGNSDDPYGTLPEAMFTLLRCLSGDDWTDLRYNLVTASRYNLISVPPVVVTIFHIFWYIFAAFLLINLVVGAVINNYQQIMEEEKIAVNKARKEELK
ncbi:MAG: ion transporter [Succinivibrio sp.]|nr:ion transporter [Succinivibrio sp.]MBR1612826.1 ion transporter [Succinivibrio sp.]